MGLADIAIALAIGAVAGWGAGEIMAKRSFGLLYNIIIGIVGGVLGGCVSRFLGISFGSTIISQTVLALGGACLLLYIISFFKKR